MSLSDVAVRSPTLYRERSRTRLCVTTRESPRDSSQCGTCSGHKCRYPADSQTSHSDSHFHTRRLYTLVYPGLPSARDACVCARRRVCLLPLECLQRATVGTGVPLVHSINYTILQKHGRPSSTAGQRAKVRPLYERVSTSRNAWPEHSLPMHDNTAQPSAPSTLPTWRSLPYLAGLLICFCLFLHWSLLRVPTSLAILSHRLSASGPTFFSAAFSLVSSA